MTEGGFDSDTDFSRRKFLKLAGGSFLSFSLPFVLSRTTHGSSARMKIGGIFSLTGPNAPVGKTIRDGAKMAEKRINDKGGIAGEIELKVVVEDGKTSQTGASEAARRLANSGDISFALGPLIGTHGAASQPILSSAGIPQIFFGGDLGFTKRHEKYPLSIRFGTQRSLQAAPILKYASEVRDHQKLYLIAPNIQPGKSFKQFTESVMGQLEGVTLVGSEFYPPFNRDFSPLMTKVMNSSAEGLIIGTGIPDDLISVAREFDRRNIDPNDFGYYTGQTPNGSVAFEKQVVNKGLGDGVIFSWHYEGAGLEREFSRTSPPAQAVKMEEAFKDEFGSPPDSPPSASWGWGSIYIIKQAIEGLMEGQGEEAISDMSLTGELPKRAISYLLPGNKSDTGPTVRTPYGNYGFLSCGQFNIRLGVATFRNREQYLLKDRGYGEDLIGPLCS
ncbi:ABC transporter substrate-binding protein [Candidatus Bipolaricaulota bacterium]|nr:ABC transporter substrate-binding protein [Candidatus Bipolaricaulota bacterium]